MRNTRQIIKTKHRGGAAMDNLLNRKRKREEEEEDCKEANDNECFICLENITINGSGDNKEKIILHKVGSVEHAVCLECANRLLKVEDDNMRCPLCRHLIAVTKKNDIIEKWRKINGMPPSLQEEEKITIDLLKELFSDLTDRINRANEHAEAENPMGNMFTHMKLLIEIKENFQRLQYEVDTDNLGYFISATNRVRADALEDHLKVMVERLRLMVRMPISGPTTDQILLRKIKNLKDYFTKTRSWFLYFYQSKCQIRRFFEITSDSGEGIKKRKTKKKSNRRKKSYRRKKSNRRKKNKRKRKSRRRR